MSATCCPVRPRRLPDGFKSTQDASRMAPRAPKTPLEWLQERPRRVPDGSRSAEDGSRSAQDASRSTQDTSHTAPGALKTRPRRLQERPRRPPEPPRHLQELPRLFQEGPRNHSWRSPSACQDAFCSTRPAREHDLKTGLWTKLIQAYGQHHSTSLCSFCRVD